MKADLQVYRISQSWAEAAQLLTRMLTSGASLGNRDRRSLRQAHGELRGLLASLTGPSHDLLVVEVASTLLEVVQPVYSRSLLVEHLARAQDVLALLLASETGLEKVTVAPAQLAWLQEFLSECCLMLLRSLATRHLKRQAMAVGS